jgi:hypothetical protein
MVFGGGKRREAEVCSMLDGPAVAAVMELPSHLLLQCWVCTRPVGPLSMHLI